jgi:hypothetical protein
MLTEDRIYDAYNGKAKAIETLSTCIEELAKLKADRIRLLAAAVQNGLYAECKNEDARKAAANSAMADIDAVLTAWEAKEREARCSYDLACNDVQMVETLVKFSK